MKRKLLLILLAVVMVVSLTLAACQDEPHVVTFESNEGSRVAPMNVTVIESESDITPSRAGYVFGGWYTSEDLSASSAVSYPYKVTQDITFYAKWISLNQTGFDVKFQTNGGTEVPSQNTNVIHSSPATTRLGYEFTGWFTASDCSGNPVTFPYIVPGAITLYAGWKDDSAPRYTATFIPGSGLPVSPMTVSVIQNEPITSWAGHTFLGWYLDRECSGERVVFPYSMTQDTTFYAKWDTNASDEYTVTFYSNGGSSVSAQTIKRGEVIATEPTTTQANATFLGWYDNSGFVGKRVDFPFEPTDDISLFAKWEPSQTNTTEQVAQLDQLLKATTFTDFQASYNRAVRTIDNNGNSKLEYAIPVDCYFDGESYGYVGPEQDSNGFWYVDTATGQPMFLSTFAFSYAEGNYTLFWQDPSTKEFDYTVIDESEIEDYFYMIFVDKISSLDPSKFYYFNDKWYAMDDYVDEAGKLVLGETVGSGYSCTYTSFALTFDNGRLDGIYSQATTMQSTNIGNGVTVTNFYYTQRINIYEVGHAGEILNSYKVALGENLPNSGKSKFPILDENDANRNNVTSDGQSHTTAELKTALQSMLNYVGYYTQASNNGYQQSYATFKLNNRGNIGSVILNNKKHYYKYDANTGAFYFAMYNNNYTYDIWCNQYSYKNNYDYNQFMLGIDSNGSAVLANYMMPAPMLPVLADYADKFTFNTANSYFEFTGDANELKEIGQLLFGDIDLVYPEANETEHYSSLRLYMNGSKVVKILAYSTLEVEQSYTDYFVREFVYLNDEAEEVTIPANVLSRFVAPGEAADNGTTTALANAISATGNNYTYKDQFVFLDDEELPGIYGTNYDTYKHAGGVTMLVDEKGGLTYLYFKNGVPYVNYKGTEEQLSMAFVGNDIDKVNEWVTWYLPINEMLNADWFYQGKAENTYYGKAECMAQLSKAIARYSGSESYLEKEAGTSIGFSNAYRWTVELDYVAVTLYGGKLETIYYSGYVRVTGLNGTHTKEFSGRATFNFETVSITVPGGVTADSSRPQNIKYWLRNDFDFSVSENGILNIDTSVNPTASGYVMNVYANTNDAIPFKSYNVTDNFNIIANCSDLLTEAMYDTYYIAIVAVGGDTGYDSAETSRKEVELSRFERVATPTLSVNYSAKQLNISGVAPNGYHLEITCAKQTSFSKVVEDLASNVSVWNLSDLPVDYTYVISVYAKGNQQNTRDSIVAVVRYTPYDEQSPLAKLLAAIDFSQSFSIGFASNSPLHYQYDRIFDADDILHNYYDANVRPDRTFTYNMTFKLAYDKNSNAGKLVFTIYEDLDVDVDVYKMTYTFSVQGDNLVGTRVTTVGSSAPVTTNNVSMNKAFAGLKTLDIQNFNEYSGDVRNYDGVVYEYSDMQNAQIQQVLNQSALLSDILGITNLQFTGFRIAVGYVTSNGALTGDFATECALTVIAVDTATNTTYAFKIRFSDYGKDLSYTVANM